jgi:hypothetical protein
MAIQEWLGIIGLLGAMIGYLELRLGKQDAARHSLRNEILSQLLEIERELHAQGKILARLEKNGQ